MTSQTRPLPPSSTDPMETPPPLRIFIIEDDLDSCHNLRDILELDAHTVSFAHTAQQALADPDLTAASVILLDWRLLETTALELLPRIGAIAPDADVVIITGHGDFDQAVTALREGAVDYLLKPINAQALRGSLQRLAQRRWLAQEKARSDAMFRNLVQAAPCLIIILRADLTITYFSPFAEQLTGYRLEHVLNRNVVELFFPGLSESGDAPELENLFEHQPAEGQQRPIQCADGSQRWIVWNTQTIDDVDGASGILAVGQDVTDFRHATEQLVQSERLSAIGEAMTGLAHESRNALQRSQAFLELLSIEVAGQDEALRLVDCIQEAQNHLHQLYEEVRLYAAPVRLERQHYLLRELMEETWDYLDQARAGRVAELKIDESASTVMVHVDRFMIQQVFRNILENSLAACSDPVLIQFKAAITQESGRNVVHLSIRDNGPGLSPVQRERIFDPFYTTKTRGTGLGMTLSKRIIEAHGGRIFIGTGPGTEIVIQFPV
ncbi:ATP-binding protein [Planctomicrobium sp. SH661]|uniref:hybrid sensor histidine kinase/response regulator n=1 Tax=Planctomicrobium sp. SH661 TaxID=3448124 RepID=UPI003F5BE9A8